MNTLATTLRNLPVKGRVERMTLTRCLSCLGVPKSRRIVKTGKNRNEGFPSYNMLHLDEYDLRDLFDRAHDIWLAGCKAIQTQHVRNHELAALWNALWQRIKLLFRRRGVEV